MNNTTVNVPPKLRGVCTMAEHTADSSTGGEVTDQLPDSVAG